MTTKPIISIVLGSYNRLEFLKLAVESAREETKDIPHEILVVDGGSSDGSAEWLLAQKDVVSIFQHNRGTFKDKPIPRRSWGYFMNLVFKTAQGKYTLMISDDTVFHPGAVKTGLDFIEGQLAQGKKVGAVPFYFHDIGHDPQDQYKVSTAFGQYYLNHGIYVSDALRDVGYANEDTYVFYASDVDMCFKLLHQGYEIIPCANALVLHCLTHPSRLMLSANDSWNADVGQLMRQWWGIFVKQGRTIESLDLATDFEERFVPYHDPTNLKSIFDTALLADSTTAQTTTASGQVNPEYASMLDNRLNTILSTIRYHVKITEDQHKQFNREWTAFKQTQRPLYRQMLSTWAIFAPLRAIKNRMRRMNQ